MRKVIFIPGFLSIEDSHVLMEYWLKKDNFKMIKFPYDNSGKTSIEASAEKLKKFIDKLKLKKDEKIDIVAFSMGGLVASFYCKFIDNKKTNKLITIFTPFKGTFWAEKLFQDREGIKEMQPKSDFLKMLNKKKFTRIKQKSFWSRIDPIVTGTSAKYLKSKEVNFFLHPFAPYWLPLIKQVEKELER